jgi:fructose-bisphosphate aldolase class I
MGTLAMKSTVTALSSPDKALPAADGSTTTLGGRLEALNIASTGGNRDAYQGPLFTIPALGEHISGAILLDETIRRKIDGEPIPGSVAESGIIPGIKSDKDAVSPASFAGERTIQGLDGKALKGSS